MGNGVNRGLGGSAHFNVANTIAEFARRHEEWQLDEFFMLIVFLSVAAFVTSFSSRGVISENEEPQNGKRSRRPGAMS